MKMMMTMKMMIKPSHIASKSIHACLLTIFVLQNIGFHAQLLPTIPSMKQIIGWPSDPEPKQQKSDTT
jgi:hypothetical protein